MYSLVALSLSSRGLATSPAVKFKRSRLWANFKFLQLDSLQKVKWNIEVDSGYLDGPATVFGTPVTHFI